MGEALGCGEGLPGAEAPAMTADQPAQELRRLRKIVARAALVVAALAIVLYVGDHALLRYRMAKDRGSDAMGSVTVYRATALKNGKVEVFFDQPETESCVRALFPHLGYRPCWYARRHTVKFISGVEAPAGGCGANLLLDGPARGAWVALS